MKPSLHQAPTKSKCVMGLMASPGLSGILFGLQQKPNYSLEIDPKFFPCCNGASNYYDETLKAAVHCEMRKRLTQTRAVYSSFVEFVLKREPSIHVIRAGNDPAIHREIAAIKQWLEHGPQAMRVNQRKHFGVLSALWVYAFAAAWRFGKKVHVVMIGKTPAHELIPKKDDIDFICVGNISRVFDPSHAYDLELIVSYAYHAGAKLFLEAAGVAEGATAKGPVEEKERGFSTKGAFKRRAAELRAKDPLDLLQGDCRSRLEFMLQRSHI